MCVLNLHTTLRIVWKNTATSYHYESVQLICSTTSSIIKYGIMCMHSILQYYKIYKQHADIIDAHMGYSFHIRLTRC